MKEKILSIASDLREGRLTISTVFFSLTTNVSAMSSGGFGTTQFKFSTNDNRNHKR